MFKLKELLSGVFEEGTHEYETIQECYELINKTVPSVASEAKTAMILADRCRIEMVTLNYLISRNISNKRSQLRDLGDSQYVRLVKLGRPSKEAIDTEIRSLNPQYRKVSEEVDNLVDVRELINSYIKSLDSFRLTALEVLKDSRRLD